MASNTGWVSVGELEMTRRISLVAASCSRASARRCASCDRREDAGFGCDLARAAGVALDFAAVPDFPFDLELAFVDFGLRLISLPWTEVRGVATARRFPTG